MLETKIDGIDALNDKLGRIVKNLLSKRTMGRAALAAEQLIKDHTEEGQDKDGNAFVGYSQTYMDKKGKQDVNLHDSGDMLSSIHGRAVSKNRGEVVFSKSLEMKKALGHINGTKRLPKRNFFGLQDKEQAEIIDLIRSDTKMILNAR